MDGEQLLTDVSQKLEWIQPDKCHNHQKVKISHLGVPDVEI